MKKKKSWKDGYCVCDRMTGFLRVTLFGAENCGHSPRIPKTLRNADALDTTELPLRPVEQLLEEEIELPLHLVLVQGFAVPQEGPNTSEQKQFRKLDSALQGYTKVRTQHQQEHGPAEQRKIQLRRNSASHAPSDAREACDPPIVARTCARVPPSRASASTVFRTSDFSSVSHNGGAPPIATDDDKFLLPVRPPLQSSGSKVTQYELLLQKTGDCQNGSTAGETAYIQTSARGVIVPARHQPDETHMAPHSLTSNVGKEVWSITLDTQSRRGSATQVMLRTSRSLFSQQHSPRSICAPREQSTHPGEATLGEAAADAPKYPRWTGFGEQTMFSRAFHLSERRL
eukprot:XP_028343427.1 uncharacterized protein LOC114485820 [Physeter catodon]